MKTKELLREWKSFLNESRIIPRSELIEIMSNVDAYDQSDIDRFKNAWEKNQFYSKYTHVLLNDLQKGEPLSHILSTISLHFNKVYQSAGPQTKSKIASGAYTCDDLRKELDQRSSFNKSEVRQQCQYQNGKPVVGNYQDFDVVYSNTDWIVIEPKTVQGSIAWAHGKPDGTEEKDENRRVGWCTATTSGNNMFPNYAGNLHMFYFVSGDYETNSSANRRLCLSYTVSNGNAVLDEKGGSTVDANNDALVVETINRIVDKNILELIESRVSERKETSFSEIYSRASLGQIIRQERQMKNQGIDQETINNEIKSYLKYTKNEEVINYIIENYRDQEVFIEIIWDDGPLICYIFEREDIEELDEKTGIVNKVISSYENSRAVSPIFSAIIYNAMEEGKDILNRSVVEKVLQIAKSPNGENITDGLVELILSNRFHKLLDFDDISDLIKMNNSSITSAILQYSSHSPIDIKAFSSHPKYKETIDFIKKKIYPEADDNFKRTILQNHSYVFENKTLKRYIRMILS